MSHFSWNAISDGLVGAHVVNIRNIFTGQEPTIFGSTSLVQQDLGMVLNELDCTKLCRILLGMSRFSELILDEIFSIETGRPFS
jgi:hypothetical protein